MKLGTLPVLTWEKANVNTTESKKTITTYKNYTSSFTKEKKKEVSWENATHLSAEVIKENQTYNNVNFYIRCAENKKEQVQHNFLITEKNDQLVDEIIVHVEKDGHQTITLNYESEENVVGYRNSLMHIIVEKNAHLDLFLIQQLNLQTTSIQTVYIEVEKNASVNIKEIEIGSCNNNVGMETILKDDKAEIDIRMSYLGEKEQELNFNYIAQHFGKKTNSILDIQGSLQEYAKKIFRGTIDFKKGSSESKGQESEFVTLLSETVKSIAIPLLLCTEDDVEGIHAANAGKIDEMVLFYLTSRGISPQEARKLIISASFHSVLENIPNEKLQKKILSLLDKKLYL